MNPWRNLGTWLIALLPVVTASCASDDRERVPASREPVSTAVERVTFSSNPYAFTVLPPAGQPYTDVVPKTLDLADMAALTLKTMTLNADPVANYKFWFQTDWQHRPSRLHHEGEFEPPNFDGDLQSQGKFLGPLVWNRLASGSDFNLLNHKRILDQLFLDVNQTQGSGGSGARLFEGFIANYFSDGNAMWKTFVLQAAQNWVEQLVDFDDSGETAYWPTEGKPPTHHNAQDPWREEVLFLAYKQLGYARALQALRKHVAFTIRNAEQFDDLGRFMDNHWNLDSNENRVNGAHFHVHGLFLQNFLNLALLVQDPGLIDFVQRSYDWAKTREAGSTDALGYFPERVEEPENGEGCSTADMVMLAVDMSRAGVANHWDDADRWVRNHFAEELLTTQKGAQLQAFSDREGDDSVEPAEFDYTGEQVTERSIGSFAGWPTPNDYRHHDRPGIQQCCTGNGSRAVFHVWEHMISEEPGGIFRINLLLNRASARADIYSHIPYVGKVEVRMKKPTADVRIRIPGWVSRSGLGLSVNGVSRSLDFRDEDKYLRIASLAPGDRIAVTFTISESTQSEVINGIRYTFTKRGSTIVSMNPRGPIAPLYDRAFYRSSPAPMVTVTRFLPKDADIRARLDPTWKLPVVAVSASSSEDDFPPEDMLDGDQADHSRWSSRGNGQFAIFDLGRRYSVKYVNGAFYRGQDRIQRFEVQVSPDGRNYTQVFNGQSGGRVTSLTGFNCASAAPARFVKLIGHGNTENNFNDFSEFEIFGTTNDTPADLAADVSASEQQGSNAPERARDGNLSTRWQADETQFIEFDLGGPRSLASLEIAFHLATSRTYRFDVEISTNGDDWMLVWTGRSSQSTLGLQSFDIPNLAASHVRIVGQGNSVDSTIGLTEVRLRGF